MWDSHLKKKKNLLKKKKISTQMCSHMNTRYTCYDRIPLASRHFLPTNSCFSSFFSITSPFLIYLTENNEGKRKKKEKNKTWTHHERCSAVETFRIQRFRHHTLPLLFFHNYKLKCLVDREARHSSRGRPQGIWDTPWVTVAWYYCAPAPLLLLLSHSC